MSNNSDQTHAGTMCSLLCFRGRGRNYRLITATAIMLWVLLWCVNHQQDVGIPSDQEYVMMRDDQNQCPERRNFVYMKEIKCASQTLVSTFRRFGYVRNLSFVLPINKKLYLGWPYHIEPNFYRPSKSKGFNILCEHSVYNTTAMRSLMPQDTIFIASLREPFSQFKSMFNYYNFVNILNLTQANPIEEYLLNFDKYERMYTSEQYSKLRFCVPNGFSMSKNLMSYILGFPTGFLPNSKDMSNDDAFIEKWINNLDKEFSLMIIVEYFHESLVLLKRLMCWDLRDILYIYQNIGSYAFREEHDQNLVDIYKQHNRVDVKLYEHFNRTFTERISKLGDDFFEEVTHYKKVLVKFSNHCAMLEKDSPKKDDVLTIGTTKWNKAFSVDETMCKSLKDHNNIEPVKEQYDQMGPVLQQPLLTKNFC